MTRSLGPPASPPANRFSCRHRAGETPAVQEALVVEGYAALFGVEDQMRDIVRAGAFAASLARRTEPLPMLLEHAPRLLAGCWTDVREDGRGLWLRGEICDDLPGAACARRALARGVDGLSIGFVPLAAHRSAGVRVLTEVELLEVSIVAHPMQRFARLSARFGSRQSAIANRGPAAADYRLPTAA